MNIRTNVWQSQKKLSSFFTMPELKRTEKLSSEPATSVKEIEGSKSLITNSNPRATSDYDEFFLPFAPLSYSSVASHNNLSRIDSIDSFVKLLDEHAGQSPHIDDEEAKGSRPVMDPSHYELSDYISQASTIHRIGPSCNRQTSPSQGSAVGVQNIKSGRHGAVEEAGSLKLSVKAGDEHAERLPSDKFRATTIKYLHFSEDVRPPYVGTYTKLTTMSMLKLRRNPFRRGLSEVDYNYDSETEWAEPDEDGEDLGSDCGDDEEGEGEIESGDEMSEFLDDEGVDAVAGTAGRRALAKSEMEPYCTGLCWEDSRGLFEESTEKRIEVMDQLNFPALQLGLLLGKKPIIGICDIKDSYTYCGRQMDYQLLLILSQQLIGQVAVRSRCSSRS